MKQKETSSHFGAKKWPHPIIDQLHIAKSSSCYFKNTQLIIDDKRRFVLMFVSYLACSHVVCLHVFMCHNSFTLGTRYKNECLHNLRIIHIRVLFFSDSLFLDQIQLALSSSRVNERTALKILKTNQKNKQHHTKITTDMR